MRWMDIYMARYSDSIAKFVKKCGIKKKHVQYYLILVKGESEGEVRKKRDKVRVS